MTLTKYGIHALNVVLILIMILGIFLFGKRVQERWYFHEISNDQIPRWFDSIHIQGPTDGQTQREYELQDRFGQPLIEHREAAFQHLMQTNMFAYTFINESGTRSSQIMAFKLLNQQPDAVYIFHDLIKRARMPGKLYALCGLYYHDPAAFRHWLHELKSRRQEVEFWDHDYGDIVQVSKVIDSRKGRYQPKLNFMWFKYYITTGWDGWPEDIQRGGLPDHFAFD